MIDVSKWAGVLTGYCTNVQPGETVAISGGMAAAPLLEALVEAVIARGGYPTIQVELPGVGPTVMSFGNDDQLQWITPFEQFSRTEADVSIRVMAETNTRALSQVDPARTSLFQRSRSGLSRTFSERAASGKVRWTLTLYPTDAYAQDAEMSTAEFARFIEQACKLDQPDPDAAWSGLRAEQARLIDFLAPKRELRLIGPGTDLTAEITDRIWINSDGKRNFPSGEVFTGPVETSAQGQLTCSFPVVTGGREISGIALRFEDGMVVDASADKNEDYLLTALESDDGARRLGEIAIGTNFGITDFTGQILLDEKIGGTAHVALGQAYPETGSQNTSAIHWDLIVDLRHGGRIEADGEPVLVDGRLVFAG